MRRRSVVVIGVGQRRPGLEGAPPGCAGQSWCCIAAPLAGTTVMLIFAEMPR